MDKHKSYIIIDWDDSLFPTSWVTNKKLDLKTKQAHHTHSIIFSELDNVVYNLLKTIGEHGKILIVTNASLTWFNTSLKILPNVSTFIKKNVPVFSARDIYSSKYPNDQLKWKKLLYIKLLQPMAQQGNIKNIVSIGDGPSEFYALINLAFKNSNNGIYFKSMRLLTTPNFKLLLDQLHVINSNASKIMKMERHLDLVFGKKQ